MAQIGGLHPKTGSLTVRDRARTLVNRPGTRVRLNVGVHNAHELIVHSRHREQLFRRGAASSGTDNTWYQVDKNQSIDYSGNVKDTDLDGTLSGATTTPY